LTTDLFLFHGTPIVGSFGAFPFFRAMVFEVVRDLGRAEYSLGGDGACPHLFSRDGLFPRLLRVSGLGSRLRTGDWARTCDFDRLVFGRSYGALFRFGFFPPTQFWRSLPRYPHRLRFRNVRGRTRSAPL